MCVWCVPLIRREGGKWGGECVCVREREREREKFIDNQIDD